MKLEMEEYAPHGLQKLHVRLVRHDVRGHAH